MVNICEAGIHVFNLPTFTAGLFALHHTHTRVRHHLFCYKKLKNKMPQSLSKKALVESYFTKVAPNEYKCKCGRKRKQKDGAGYSPLHLEMFLFLKANREFWGVKAFYFSVFTVYFFNKIIFSGRKIIAIIYFAQKSNKKIDC